MGFNGDLLYVISNGDFDSVFKIDTLTGELFVDAQLDRETTSDYLLNITVQDQGSPRSKAVSKLLHVIIEDVNDNAPQFIKSSFSFFFPENTPKGKKHCCALEMCLLLAFLLPSIRVPQHYS